ncbi:MAG TPA: hypothetical protein VJT31_33045, partial [Rugosimonospora sp.]|nr:hypothetical protein [Rugosimonospora sp.]
MRRHLNTHHPGGVLARPGHARPYSLSEYGILAVTIAVTASLWRHATELLGSAQPLTLAAHLPVLLRDAMIGVPFALAAALLAARLARPLGIREDRPAGRAVLVSVLCAPLFIPLVMVVNALDTVFAGNAGEHAHHAAAARLDLAGLASGAVRDALMAQPVVFLATLVAFGVAGAEWRL